MANVVLVHGAWSDGSVWRDVIMAVHREGHRVLAVQLPLTSLVEDSACVRRAVAAVDGPVTLVGHSYGGFAVCAAAQGNAQVNALVFVAAYVPEAGESVVHLSAQGAPMLGGEAIRFDGGRWSTLDPDLFDDALGPGLPQPLSRALAAAQRPTQSACFTGTATGDLRRDLPCAYVSSRDDRILDPALQRRFAARASATVTDLATGHLSPVSRPIDVAQAILRALPSS